MENQKLKNFLKDPRTNWKFIIILIIFTLIVAGGVFGYLKWQIAKQVKKLTEFPELKIPEKVEDETVKLVPSEVEGWKTYRNEEFGFEVRYPREVRVDATEVDNIKFIFIHKQNSIQDEFSLNIGVGDNPLNFSAKGFVKKLEEESIHRGDIALFGDRILKREEVIIADFPAYKINIFSFDEEIQSIYISKANHIYVLSYPVLISTIPEQDFRQYIDIFNQMLSTFRFLE